MSKTAVILLNLGGPDSLDSVQPFLYNLFSDPNIISLPLSLLIQKPVAGYIARRRSQNVRKHYAQIGGKSPILEWTEKQRKMLENRLRQRDANIDVFIAMRYWHPLTREAVEKIEQFNYTKIILLPLYPHYSKTTTGSSFSEWDRVYSGNSSRVEKINEFYDNAHYITAINKRIDEALLKFPETVRNNVHLVFSAHGTPVKLVNAGDPYLGHIEMTVNAVMDLRKFDHSHTLCFQSKVGPEKWLEPATDTTIKELAASGKKHLLVIPTSFVSDHIETLFELNIEYRHVAEESGVEQYTVMEGLNDSELFIAALYELVTEKL